jgi:hypothetical protein
MLWDANLLPLYRLSILASSCFQTEGLDSVYINSNPSSWPINCILSRLRDCRKSRKLKDIAWLHVPDNSRFERAYFMCLELCMGSDAFKMSREIVHDPAVACMTSIEDMEDQYTEVVMLLFSNEGLQTYQSTNVGSSRYFRPNCARSKSKTSRLLAISVSTTRLSTSNFVMHSGTQSRRPIRKRITAALIEPGKYSREKHVTNIILSFYDLKEFLLFLR